MSAYDTENSAYKFHPHRHDVLLYGPNSRAYIRSVNETEQEETAERTAAPIQERVAMIRNDYATMPDMQVEQNIANRNAIRSENALSNNEMNILRGLQQNQRISNMQVANGDLSIIRMNPQDRVSNRAEMNSNVNQVNSQDKEYYRRIGRWHRGAGWRRGYSNYSPAFYPVYDDCPCLNE